ncbi:PREDICTED: chaperone dnaJ GFA2 mitochondrial [Prunus dulcis]|uniref:PREDICTED: chaperone dnaJ GFA2 mitochondrial n=1 Tax=Prunus dulcis TaxID=3755 RepID=A0A5E4EX95_PRUDU|nr:PREDICTED: chaperone dnaJ GFA2 mitochondrial [Prunus dulcis]
MVGHSAFEDQGNGSPNDFRNLFKDIFDNDVEVVFLLAPDLNHVSAVKGLAWRDYLKQAGLYKKEHF